jgi:hypothetical protein
LHRHADDGPDNLGDVVCGGTRSHVAKL